MQRKVRGVGKGWARHRKPSMSGCTTMREGRDETSATVQELYAHSSDN
jgi:hypothetical protein